jgi:uncharacterized membrane protein
MCNKNLSYIALIAVIVIICAYLANFLPIFGLSWSADSAVWGQFGDYVGGTLNPILSFLSVVLLIRSLSLQTEANEALKNELRANETAENFRSFSSLFFNMIESQRNGFREFSVHPISDTASAPLTGARAVLYIEKEIEIMRESQASDMEISDFLEALDAEDRIFAILRMFYITVKTTCDKLSEREGFESAAAKEQIITLFNFTDFSQLRLIMIGVQFLEFKSSQYLRSNELFTSALDELHLKLDMY